VVVPLSQCKSFSLDAPRSGDHPHVTFPLDGSGLTDWWRLARFALRLEFIAGHAGLKVLKLNNNGMGPAGGAMIAGALLKNAENAKAAGRPAALEVVVCGTLRARVSHRAHCP